MDAWSQGFAAASFFRSPDQYVHLLPIPAAGEQAGFLLHPGSAQFTGPTCHKLIG
jgi:hypothetical protein